MQGEREPWEDFEISPDFTEKLMRRVAKEPQPKRPLWRRLDAWESRLNDRRALRIALRITAFLAGAMNLAGLYIFLIGV
jgi:hypothetical protein